MAKFYPAGGGGSGGWDDVGDIPSDGMPVIVVSGAGTTSANGTYFEILSDYNGKPIYSLSDGSAYIYWDSNIWNIYAPLVVDEKEYTARVYYSTDDVATPDLVTTWLVDGMATPPAPIVITGTANHTTNYAVKANGSGNSEWGLIFPYLVYTAILNQTTDTAPVATELYSTLPFSPTYAYEDPGQYSIFHPMFGPSRTILLCPSICYDDTENSYRWIRVGIGEGEIYLRSYSDSTIETNADGILNLPIEIRVYPG